MWHGTKSEANGAEPATCLLGQFSASGSYQDLMAENQLLHAVIDNFPGGILLYGRNLRRSCVTSSRSGC